MFIAWKRLAYETAGTSMNDVSELIIHVAFTA